MKKYVVKLTSAEREDLAAVARRANVAVITAGNDG